MCRNAFVKKQKKKTHQTLEKKQIILKHTSKQKYFVSCYSFHQNHSTGPTGKIKFQQRAGCLKKEKRSKKAFQVLGASLWSCVMLSKWKKNE